MHRITIFLIIAIVNTYSVYAYNLLIQEKESFSDSQKSDLVVYRNDSLFNYLKGELNFLRKVNSNSNNISSYNPILKNKILFLVSGLGGGVYKETSEGLSRIDNSFEHKNQLASSLFVYNDTIFKFGGYGFFDTRNFFTYYSEQTNEWEVYPTNSIDFPKGRMDNKFVIDNNHFYMLGGRTIDVNDRNNTEPLNDIWKFSFITKEWELLGNYDFLSNLTFNRSDFKSNNFFFFKSEGDWYSLDLNEYKLSLVNSFDFLKKVKPGSRITKTKDSLYFLLNTQNTDSKESYLFSFSSNEFESSQIEIPTKSSSLPPFILYILIVVVVVVVVGSFYFKNKRLRIQESLVLDGMNLSYKNFRVRLTELEKQCIQLLLENEVVTNNQLLDLITNDLDISQKTRIKNTLVRDINNKLDIISNGRFMIQKRPSAQDRRFSEYHLEKN